jgi:putative OPT family oligopeptide transporter
MQLIGVIPAAFVMAPVMTVLHQGSLNAGTGGIGGTELPAPQAGLFAALANGFFADGVLPRDMVIWGMGIGLVLLILDFMLNRAQSKVRLHVMPVAVGIYLPFGLAVPILLGGLVRYWVDRRDGPEHERGAQRGVLMTSGLIAGESLAGVLLGLLAYLGLRSWTTSAQLLSSMGLSPQWQDAVLQLISLAALLAVAGWVYRRSSAG